MEREELTESETLLGFPIIIIMAHVNNL